MNKEQRDLVDAVCSLLSLAMLIGCFVFEAWLLQYWLSKFGVELGLMNVTWKQSIAIIVGIRLLVSGRQYQKAASESDSVETLFHTFGICLRRVFMFAVLWVI